MVLRWYSIRVLEPSFTCAVGPYEGCWIHRRSELDLALAGVTLSADSGHILVCCTNPRRS